MPHTKHTQPPSPRSAQLRRRSLALYALCGLLACCTLFHCTAFPLGCRNNQDCPTPQRCVDNRCIVALCTLDEECKKELGPTGYCDSNNDCQMASQKYGELCSKNDPRTACISGLFCLALEGQVEGYCTKNCKDDNAKCESFDPGGLDVAATCVRYNQKESDYACVLTCEKIPVVCPTGLTCRPQGNGKLCLR